MHHPGCWVTNGGCATQTEHRIAPQAMAYTSAERPAGTPAQHPGEGTRLGPLPAAAESPAPAPIPLRPLRQHEPAVQADDEGPIIGAAPSAAPMIHRTLPSTVGVPPSAPRRYQPPPGEHMPRRQMPKIYDRHPILGYWYLPAAVLVAILVAFSVVWLVGLFTGDDGPDQASNPTPAPTTGGLGNATPTPGTASPTASGATQSAGPSTGAGKFKGGDAVLVTGAAPDCLNVRVAAGTGNDAIVCVQEGTELRITGGPTTASELTWWKVETELGEGWAAEDYLSLKP
jgi:hypothetical protein